LNELSDETHPLWKEAIESVVYGGKFLQKEATPYGEQQAERNEFSMSDYRDEFGNREQVTAFPALEQVAEASGNDAIQIPVAPESGVKLPLNVGNAHLSDALIYLREFPAEPGAQKPGDGVNRLVVLDEFLSESEDLSAGDEQLDAPGGTSPMGHSEDKGEEDTRNSSGSSEGVLGNRDGEPEPGDTGQGTAPSDTVSTADRGWDEDGEEYLDWDVSVDVPPLNTGSEKQDDRSADDSEVQKQQGAQSRTNMDPPMIVSQSQLPKSRTIRTCSERRALGKHHYQSILTTNLTLQSHLQTVLRGLENTRIRGQSVHTRKPSSVTPWMSWRLVRQSLLFSKKLISPSARR